MNMHKSSILMMALLLPFSVCTKDADDIKIIEYHELKYLDSATQEVLKQFANAADTILVVGTHSEDKRLVVKKIAQLLADITKFVVEATRKVCRVGDFSEYDVFCNEDGLPKVAKKSDVMRYVSRVRSYDDDDEYDQGEEDLGDLYRDLAKSLDDVSKVISKLDRVASKMS